jgi:hypothetical protein
MGLTLRWCECSTFKWPEDVAIINEVLKAIQPRARDWFA